MGYKLIYISANISEEKDTKKKNHYKPYMTKKAIDSGTRGRKNKVLKRPIDLTGINKVPNLDKCPLGKCPPTKVCLLPSLADHYLVPFTDILATFLDILQLNSFSGRAL